MAGITFSIGGKLDPSYKGALSQSVTEAKIAATAINAQIAVQQKAPNVGLRSGQQVVAMAKLREAYNPAFLKKFGDATAEAHARIPGLSLVLRETLVMFREIGRGAWSNVPGTMTRLLQGLRQMRGELGIFGALFSLTGAAIVGSVGAIVASFFIWEHRVKSLTQALLGLNRVDMPAPDISRLSAFEAGWRRVTEAIHGATVELTSANEIFKNHMALVNQAQGTEKRLLELEKQKALDEAGNNPAKRAAIRAQFAQREHDLEKKHQDENTAAQREHIADLKRSQDDNLAAAQAIKVATADEDKVYEEHLKKQVAENNKVLPEGHWWNFAQAPTQMGRDQATVERLTKLKSQEVEIITAQGPTGAFKKRGLSDTDQAVLDAAQGRFTQAQKDKTDLDEFLRTKKHRDDLRTEQERLFHQSAKDAADKIKSEGEYNQALALNSKILADNDKLRSAEEATAGAKDLDGRHGGHHADVTARERMGLGAPGQNPLLNINQSMDRNIKILVEQGRRKQSGGMDHGTDFSERQF